METKITVFFLIFLFYSVRVYGIENTTSITFREAKYIFLRNGTSLLLQGEKLFQAYKKIGLSRRDFMIDGSTVASTALFQNPYFTGLNLTVHLLKLPSRWFAYRSNQHTYQAEIFAMKSLERDLWLQLAEFYYTAQKNYRSLEDLGAVIKYQKDPQNKVASIPHEQKETFILQFLKLEKLVTKESNELKDLLDDTKYKLWGREPSAINQLKKFLNEIDSIEGFIDSATESSFVVRHLQSLIFAAKSMVTSEKFSILSFTGLGIGYLEALEISESKVQELEVKLKETKRTIRSQILTALKELKSNLIAFEMLERKWRRSKKEPVNIANPDSWQTILNLNEQARESIAELFVSCAKFAHHIGYDYHGTCQITPQQKPNASSKKYSLRHEVNSKNTVKIWIDSDFDSFLDIKKVKYKWGYFHRSKRSGSYSQKFEINIPEGTNQNVIVTIEFWNQPNVVIDLNLSSLKSTNQQSEHIPSETTHSSWIRLPE